jgi:Zn-dependent M28 family amino/carboxypeptidase
MIKMFRIIVIVAISYLIIRYSTYGWRFYAESTPDTATAGNKRLAEALKSHVRKLSYEIGDRSVFQYKNLAEAADYILKEFKSKGYSVELHHYEVDEKRVSNIIATKGFSAENRVVIVGAHYDTCFNPGADDNASGVAILLELAGILRDEKTAAAVKFIAFVNEEPPFFKTDGMGSRQYTKHAKYRKENIKAAIILESMGYYSDKPNSQRYPPLFGIFYPNRADFIAVVGNLNSYWLLKTIVPAFKKKTAFPIETVTTFSFVPGVDFSDHWSFWKEGYPAVMITDTAFYRNTDYHTDSDTYEKLDYISMAEVTKGLAESIIEISSKR